MSSIFADPADDPADAGDDLAVSDLLNTCCRLVYISLHGTRVSRMRVLNLVTFLHSGKNGFNRFPRVYLGSSQLCDLSINLEARESGKVLTGTFELI